MRRFLTPGWLARHLAMLVLVIAFLGLGWWQVSRAAAGNTLSFGYAVQWPLFAGFVFLIWLREVRSELRSGSAVRPRAPVATAESPFRPPVRITRPAATVDDDAADPDLVAYNRYLAWLAADPQRRPDGYQP